MVRRHILMVVPLCFAWMLCAASGELSSPSGAGDAADVTAPTNFDFLVLASIADSAHPLAMTSYRR